MWTWIDEFIPCLRIQQKNPNFLREICRECLCILLAAGECCLLTQQKRVHSSSANLINMPGQNSTKLLTNFMVMQPQIAAVYNLNSNTFRRFPMTDSPFCSGHIQLRNGSVLVVGGTDIATGTGFADGRFNVRVFNPGASPSYRVVARMPPNRPATVDPNSGARWYPTLCTMTDGNVLIVGGQTTEGKVSNDHFGTNQCLTYLDAIHIGNAHPY